MVVVFFIVVVLVIIGLVYLIYLPFKSRLKKSGKLTDKLNLQINLTFVLFLYLISVLLYCIKDYRTPSKDRIEKVSDVKLPKKFNVLKDEYQDTWQDYCILYDIQFDKNVTTEFIKAIKAAKFYNANVKPNSKLYDSLFITVDKENDIWYKSEKGYRFSRKYGLTTYSIELDTLTLLNKINLPSNLLSKF